MSRPEFMGKKLGDSIIHSLQPFFDSLADPEEFDKAREALYQDIVTKTQHLERLLDGYDPYEILANLSAAQLLINPETYKEPLHEGDAFVVEHAALLLLKSPYPKNTNPGVPDLDEVIALAKEIKTKTVFLYGVKKPSGPKTGEESAKASLNFLAMASDFSVRAPGYEHHLREDLANLFQPIQGELKEHLGFSIDDLLKLEDAYDRLHQSKIESQRKTVENFKTEIMAALKEKRAPVGLPTEFNSGVVSRLKAVRPDLRDDALEMLGAAWFTSTMGRYSFAFGTDELANEMATDEKTVKLLLDFFALEFESQAAEYVLFNTSHALKANPFLVNEGRYLYPIPGTLLWAAKPRLEAYLNPDVKSNGGSKTLWKRYKDHRAKYLEEKSLELLGDKLRLSRTYRGLYYYLDGDTSRRCELDGLVLYDKTVIFVEAKAGAFSKAARQGRPLGLKTDLQELISKAHEQGLRARDYFNSTDHPKFLTDSGEEILLDKKRFTRSLVLTTTLDPLDVFQSSISLLAKAGYTKNEELPWAVSLGSLRVVCDLAEFPSQIIDYAFKRKRAAESKEIFAHDELDWFAHYLSTGLYFEGEEFKKADKIHLNTLEASAIDDYFNYQQGIRSTPAPRPRINIPELLREWILELDYGHDFEGRSETILMLLDWAGSSMDELVKQYSRIRARTYHDKKLHDFSLASKDGGGVTFFTVCGDIDEKILKRLQLYVGLKKYQTRVQRWVGFISNVDKAGHIHGVVFDDSPWIRNDEMEKVISQLP